LNGEARRRKRFRIYENILLKSIEENVDTAKTHLWYHIMTEGKFLNLDKNCEYCQIYFKEEDV